MRLHGLRCRFRVTKRDGLRHTLMFGIALAQTIGGALAHRAEVQACVATDLTQERVQIGGQPIAGGGGNCGVKVEIGARALLLGQRDGGALDAPDIDGCGAHRRHSSKRRLKNRSQLRHFNWIGSADQRFGTAAEPPGALADTKLAPLAQLGQCAPQLMPRHPKLSGQITF